MTDDWRMKPAFLLLIPAAQPNICSWSLPSQEQQAEPAQRPESGGWSRSNTFARTGSIAKSVEYAPVSHSVVSHTHGVWC